MLVPVIFKNVNIFFQQFILIFPFFYELLVFNAYINNISFYVMVVSYIKRKFWYLEKMTDLHNAVLRKKSRVLRESKF
jgi:hypothetical protein